MKGPLLLTAGARKGFKIPEIIKVVKHLYNVFVDRRIDYWAYRIAPGYRPYYEAMYKAYWESPQIDLGLQSGEYNTPTIGNYLFHITNMINPWFDTNALPELDLIYGKVDVESINRFDTDRWHPNRTKVVLPIFALACEVAEIMFRNSPSREEVERTAERVEDIIMEPDKNECENPGGSGGSGDDEQEPNLDPIETSGSDDGDGDEKSGDGEDEDEDGGKGERKEKHATEEDPEASELNDEVLKHAIKRQQSFSDGKVDKQVITADIAKDVEAIESTNATIEHIAVDGIQGAKVVVIRKLSKAVLNASTFRFSSGRVDKGSKKAVSDGIRLGRLLARKLALRNQAKITKRNRRKKGHIDRRRLAAIGSGERNIFCVDTRTTVNPALLHLSLDASGSMMGEPWRRGLALGVSLAQVASEIKNLHVVISIRAGDFNDTATVAIIYDSRIDSMTKIRSLFPFLTNSGNTPEGLCYQAIMSEIVDTKIGERYFVNVSDGMPYFGKYSGEPAFRHTKSQVDKIRATGVNVMSYYVGGGENNPNFTKMYGKDAKFIDVEGITAVSRTLNELFLRSCV